MKGCEEKARYEGETECSEFVEAVQGLCGKAWYDIVVIPDDVPQAEHGGYRKMLQRTLKKSLKLLKTVLEPRLRSEFKGEVPSILTVLPVSLLTLQACGMCLSSVCAFCPRSPRCS
ncbi:hypothetical protein CYMTET_24916 [Cymbomonas tetramitiformis]|uniref:Uncharacterized protein n=1 Tax=Cymbomonas tetramitiformis TaxID=36881 RepID=A0AAE0KZG4_9CHLO|nr:hypothetical protein CYMTET_24916 [Cymbomonas tetramitiformis]